MKIAIESTEQVFTISGIPMRVWVGETRKGTPVIVLVHAISPQTTDPVKLEEFDRDLQPLDDGPEIQPVQ